MRPLLIVFALIICLSATARADNGALVGTGIGAAVGGLLGSQIGRDSGQLAATGIGIVAGGLIGNSIGQSIDDDQAPSVGGNYSATYAGPASVAYSNSYTPNYVAPPAPPPTYASDGTYCREYSQEIRIAGRMEESYGTACLQPDGTWRIVQ